MASTLYISIPARALVQNRPDWVMQTLPFAIFSAEGNVLQHGHKNFTELKVLSGEVRQLSLLVDASDVSLFVTKVPPMSAAKFKSALPNLLEEQITGDPSDTVLVAGPIVEGESTVAVCDRRWIEHLAMVVKDWPVKKIVAYPAQLALILSPDSGKVSAVFEDSDEGLSLLLRTGLLQGAGFKLASNERDSLINMLNILAPENQADIYVSANEIDGYQSVIDANQLGERMFILPLGWATRVGGIQSLTPDLMSNIASIHKPAIDWASWRWPLRLVAMILVVNVVALNLEWFNLKRSAKNLNDVLIQTYKTSFPKETTILNPLLQMRQKVNQTKKLAGQFAPDDFVVFASRFAQVWDRVMVGKTTTIASLDYKEHGLEVRVKSVSSIPMEQLRTALEEQAMRLTTTSDGVLHIAQVEAK